jgi:uncharacterized damage-inducible protein DinB
MITPAYVQTMARYNAWQNRSIFGAADTLDEVARKQNRGAFFGSIHNTLSHILWGDTIWMSRFDGWTPPDVPIGESGGAISDWGELKRARLEADARFIDWGTRVNAADFLGELCWYSGAVQHEVCKPRALLIMQIFNHQTHHRGQVHAMLTAAGARPDDTDLPFME